MAAVGFATLPVIPSFDGISARIDKAISQPIRKASKDAGDALGKGVSAGVDESAKKVEKAQFRVKKSTQELEAAESKLSEQKHKTEAANLAVEAAARKREDAEGKGIEAVSKAEQDLLKKRAAAERESRNLTKAEEAHESALTESARAAESLEKRQDELAKANEGSSRTFRELREEVRNAGDELDETANKASTFGDKFTAGLAEIGRGALLGIGAKIGTTIMGGVQEAVSTGWETAMSLDQVSRSLSAMTSETQVAEDMMVSLREVASDRPIDYTSFLEGANTLAYMGYEGEQAIKVMDNVGRAAVGAGRDGDDAMQTVIGALGKMQANGKVTAEEIGQISNSGVPMLSALIDHFDMAEGSFGELSSMISEGKVDLEDVIGALEEAGGADFENLHNSFENVNSSLENQIAMLKDDVFTSIGESLQPILQDMDFEAIADTVGDVVGRIISLLPGMVEIAMTAFDKLGGVIGDVSGVLESVWGWIEKNKDALKALVVGVGIAVGAWTLFNGIMQAHAISIQIADKGWKGYIRSTNRGKAAMDLFNKATKANIIGIIATALIAVGGALVYFFTQTETGRELWNKFTDALGDGWDWLTDKLGGGIDWITEKFSEFTGWISETWNNITGWISDAWNGIVSLFQGDFTSQMREAFGVEEDSPIIGFFFTIRDAVISVGDFISAFWDGLVNAAQWVITVLGTVLITPFVLYWNMLSGAVKFAWENVIKPAWDAMASAATWLWENVLSPVFTWIGDKWTALSDTFSSVWEIIKTAVFDAFTWYIDRVKANFELVTGALNTAWTWLKDQFLVVWGFIRDLVFTAWNNAVNNVSAVFAVVTSALSAAWTWLKDMLMPVWETIRDAVFHAFENVARGAQFVFETVTGAISGAWSWLSDMLHAGWTWIKENVFDAMGRGLDTVQGWFQSAVDGITNIWDGIRAAAAKPVKFVVDTVFNNGIRKAWNSVAKFTGLDKLDEIGLGDLGKFASGGILPGYTPGRDPYNFVDPASGTRVAMSGGEAIMRPEWTRAVGKNSIDAMNAAAMRGGVRGVQRLLGGDASGFVSRFAKGGIFDHNGDTKRKEEVSERIVAAQDFVRREHGKPYQWGGVGDPSWDCSGLASGVVHVINGQDGRSGRLFNTTSFMANPGAFGFSEGLHGPVTFGVSSDHMSGTLAGINFESASDPKGVQLGGSAWGSDNPYYTNRYTLDAILGEFISGGAGGGSGFNLGAMVKGLWDSAIGAIGSWSGPGMIGKLPGAMLSKLAESAWNFVKDRIGAFFGSGGEAGNRESWREMAMDAMRRNGFNADDPAQVNAMLDQIMSESGGIPDRNQEIVDVNGTGASAGQGLLQIIPGTFAAHRDPELPDDRTDAWANMNAALRYYRATYGEDLTTMWGHGHGYATGGVLPGYTPGRDVHRFFSPTGGALALSGGEAIMVPEWTRAVGGPSAVAAMNAAASGGRTGGTPGAFAAGGVWSGASDDFVKKFADATKNLNEAATKLADASTDEGIMARSGLSKLAEGFGLVGFDNSASVINSVLGAEQQLMEAREGYSTRIAAISEAEKEHAEALKELDALRKSDSKMSVENQRKLADAQKAVDKAKAAQAKASSDKQAAAAEKVADAEEKLKRVREDIAKDADKDAQAHADEVVKATERVTAAEQDLAQKRKESVAALDVTIFEVAPQISGMLSQAAKASSAIPQVSSALAGMAAMAGPAGISVGVAVQGILTAIDLVQKIGTAIGDFVSSIFAARTAMYSLTVQGLESVYNAAKTVDDLRASVVGLRISWVEAQVSLRDAAWKTRLAQADVVRAQLEGVRSVADAEAALEKERKRVARAAALHLDDLSLMYDRYRWLEYEGMFDRLDLAAQITPEILALEAEVNAAKLTALANQRSASLSALEASWEQQKAALNLQQVQANLAMQTQQLALMQSEFGGFGQAGSLQAMNTAKLYEERSKIQQQMGQNFWRLSYHLTGASAADKKRIAELDKLIAEREASGAGIGKTVGGTDWMSFFGYGDSAANALKNSGYGDAETAMWKLQEQQQLQQIEIQKQQLEQQIEQNKLFEEYQKQIGELTAEIEALKAGASASQYEADSFREDNPAVKAALEALARFEAERSAEYGAVAAGQKQVVEITIPEQDTYSREQVEALLAAVQQIGSIDARVKMLETPAKPGANQVLQDITRRY